MVTISGVETGSLAEKKGIQAGDVLVNINGRTIEDVLDYRFCLTEPVLRMTLRRGQKYILLTMRKQPDQDIGLVFDTYLMDKQRSCRNKCIFCFIDQLPPGLRNSLYFKDDDSRMSFLFGNYITLTNLRERDIQRIMEMRISPINVSVHTTNPQLRNRMMGNRFAGESLAALQRFAAAGLTIHCQLVLCPGWNDGAELERTMQDLAALAPAVASVSAVPVGITRYREGLEPLRPFTRQEAATIIDQVERMGDQMLAKFNDRIFYPSDEFFLLAQRPIPPADYYGEFHQLENGVGMTALFMDQFRHALSEMPLPSAAPSPVRVLMATGTAFEPFLSALAREFTSRFQLDADSIQVAAIQNQFFGQTITVAGLITGRDLIDQLKQQVSSQSYDLLLIPATMLRREGDIFLDDVSLAQVQTELNLPVKALPTDGAILAETLLSIFFPHYNGP